MPLTHISRRTPGGFERGTHDTPSARRPRQLEAHTAVEAPTAGSYWAWAPRGRGRWGRRAGAPAPLRARLRSSEATASRYSSVDAETRREIGQINRSDHRIICLHNKLKLFTKSISVYLIYQITIIHIIHEKLSSIHMRCLHYKMMHREKRQACLGGLGLALGLGRG